MVTTDELKQEIIDWVAKRWSNSPGTFTSAFYDFHEVISWGEGEIELPSGTAKKVEGEDAGEGDYSADIYIVFSLGEQLFRIDGHYESWAGSEWEAEDMYECAPVQVLVTQYQRKG